MNLPSHLRQTVPLEPEDIPLQVALLTMEVATLHTQLQVVVRLLEQLTTALTLPSWFED